MTRSLLIFITYIWLVSPVLGQTYVQSGSLYVHTNSQLIITGDVINNGNLVNQGSIALTGNWQNLASYPSANGTIALIGTAPQLFSPSGQAVGVLYIENPTTVKLTTNTGVENSLVLQEGVVILAEGVKLTLAADATAAGGGSNAYINGRLYHTGTGPKFFPIGKNGVYAPLTLLQAEGQNPVVGAEFYDRAVQPLAGSGLQLHSFYWNINSLSGTYTGSPVSLQVPLSYLPREQDQYMLAGSQLVDAPFVGLADADWEILGDGIRFSANSVINSPIITVGQPEDLGPRYYLPNALSPSAPHPEDRVVKLYSKTVSSEGFQWTIWDSWGHIVYTTTSYTEAATQGWQGTYAGKGEAQPGMYKYLLQGTYSNGQTFSQKGTILLYR